MSDIIGLKSWAPNAGEEMAPVAWGGWLNCWSVHRFSGRILPVRCVFGWVETLETLLFCNVKRRIETQEILSFAADALRWQVFCILNAIEQHHLNEAWTFSKIGHSMSWLLLVWNCWKNNRFPNRKFSGWSSLSFSNCHFMPLIFRHTLLFLKIFWHCWIALQLTPRVSEPWHLLFQLSLLPLPPSCSSCNQLVQQISQIWEIWQIWQFLGQFRPVPWLPPSPCAPSCRRSCRGARRSPGGVGLGLRRGGPGRAAGRGRALHGRLLPDVHPVAATETAHEHGGTVTRQGRNLRGKIHRIRTNLCQMANLWDKDFRDWHFGRRWGTEKLHNCGFWKGTVDPCLCLGESMAESEFGQIGWLWTPRDWHFEWL